MLTSSVQRMCVVLRSLTCLCCLQAGDDTSSGNTSAGTSAKDASADNASADKADNNRTGKVYDIEASSSLLGNRVATEKAADLKVNEFTVLNLISHRIEWHFHTTATGVHVFTHAHLCFGFCVFRGHRIL